MADFDKKTDKNESQSFDFDKAGITRNEEPTRFLTQEEMEELEHTSFSFNGNSNKENQVGDDENSVNNSYEKNTAEEKKPFVNGKSKIKVEEVKPADRPQTNTVKIPGLSSGNIGMRISKKNKIKKFFKRIVFVICFIMAAFLGFYLAFTWNTQNESADNAKQHNIKQIEIQKQSLEEERQNLEKERSQLEAEKDKLNAQHQELTKEKSFFIKIIDTVTGKDKEDKDKAEAVKNKIDEAQNIIDDVDAKIDKVSEMKNQIDDLKSQAQEKISENRNIIDTVQYQIIL